jgi:3-oxoacyl-(acyl-carrier-protein) synthase
MALAHARRFLRLLRAGAQDRSGRRAARVQPDYINAHATGTIWNDKNETKAIKEVFGERAYEIPVVGNKAAFGHSIAGSGALELIGCILSLRDQIVPPTINYKIPDPECDLNYVIEGSRKMPLRNVMSNSFAFGGSNAVLVVGKYEPNHNGS